MYDLIFFLCAVNFSSLEQVAYLTWKLKLGSYRMFLTRQYPRKQKQTAPVQRNIHVNNTYKGKHLKKKKMHQHCFLLIRELTFLGWKLFLHESHSSLQKPFSPYLKIALKFLLHVLENGLSLLENGLSLFDNGFFINCYFLKTTKRCSTVLCYCRPGCEGRFLVLWQLLESGHVLTVLVIIHFYKVMPNSAALLQQY